MGTVETMALDNPRVLIVDDQADIHDDFDEMLGGDPSGALTAELAHMFLDEARGPLAANFELLHATSGEAAVDIVAGSREAEAPIAVAFVDIRMPPGIDGVETVRRIRDFDRDVEVVIMTAYTDKRLADIVQDMELIHKLLYIRKPFAREEIQQIALSLAAKWDTEQQLIDARERLASSRARLQALLDATDEPAQPKRTGRIEPVATTTRAGRILTLAELERRAVLRAVAAMDNNISKAARALGISRTTLYRKLQKSREKS